MDSRLRLSWKHLRTGFSVFHRKAERESFSVFLAAVLSVGIILPNSLPAADSLPAGLPADITPVSTDQVSVLAKKTTLPLFVFGDESGRLSHFVPSGYMGDVNSLSTLTSTYDSSAPSTSARTGHTSMRIKYLPKGKQGWAGIYWLSPANNWGTTKGAGFDMRKAIKLTFWIRGESGGERISQFKVGGVNGPYPDSDVASIGPMTLTKDWQQLTIDLKGKDLRYIIGGFMFLIRRADNQTGATFYLDQIVFRGLPQDESEMPVAKNDAVQEPPMQNAYSGPSKNSNAALVAGLNLGKAGSEENGPEKIVPVVVGRGEASSGRWGEAEPVPTPGPWLRYRRYSRAK